MTTATEPLVYDPYAYEIHEDPYPTYARLREEAPLYRNEERGFWALSRYADVLAAFRDSDTFSSAEGVSIDPAASGPHAHRTMSFLAMDPPQHGRMRGLVSRGFTPRRVADMEDRIRTLTVAHLDACLEQRSFDFVSGLAGTRWHVEVTTEDIPLMFKLSAPGSAGGAARRRVRRDVDQLGQRP